MTMRIHRAVRTLSLLLALSMLLSVSAISSAAKRPPLPYSPFRILRSLWLTGIKPLPPPHRRRLGTGGRLSRCLGRRPYLVPHPGGGLPGRDALSLLLPRRPPGPLAGLEQRRRRRRTVHPGRCSRVVQRRQGHRDPALYRRFLYRHQRRLLQKPERLAQLYRHVHPVRPERDTVVAETDMTVNAYDSYVRYDDIDESIQDIIDEALPGRYITVTTFGQSEGGRTSITSPCPTARRQWTPSRP